MLFAYVAVVVDSRDELLNILVSGIQGLRSCIAPSLVRMLLFFGRGAIKVYHRCPTIPHELLDALQNNQMGCLQGLTIRIRVANGWIEAALDVDAKLAVDSMQGPSLCPEVLEERLICLPG